MKRVGLLAGLLVLTLGTGVVAQSPSPEASPLFAPDDLEFTLPAQVEELKLTFIDYDLSERMESDAAFREQMRYMLLPLGKEPADVMVAAAYGYDEATGQALRVSAYRIEGVAVSEVFDVWLALLAGVEDLSDPPEDVVVEWVDFDGREVLLASMEGQSIQVALYPKGEVLYAVAADGVTFEDVLTKLP